MNFLTKIFQRNFSTVTKAKIKFLGKRSLLNRNPETHLENNIHNVDKNFNILENNNSKKVKIQQNIILNSYRLKVTNEEMEIVNNGGPLNVADWTKIKLKPKNK